MHGEWQKSILHAFSRISYGYFRLCLIEQKDACLSHPILIVEATVLADEAGIINGVCERKGLGRISRPKVVSHCSRRETVFFHGKRGSGRLGCMSRPKVVSHSRRRETVFFHGKRGSGSRKLIANRQKPAFHTFKTTAKDRTAQFLQLQSERRGPLVSIGMISCGQITHHRKVWCRNPQGLRKRSSAVFPAALDAYGRRRCFQVAV